MSEPAMHLPPRPLEEWLACDSPWVRYRARQLFLGETAEKDRAAVLNHPRVKAIVREARTWPAHSQADHRAGKDLLNKVAVLSDFGLRRGDPGIDAFAERVLAHRDERGRVLNHVRMPKRTKPEWLYDVDGQDPLLSLVTMGFDDDPRVSGAVRRLIETADENGGWIWPDAPSPLPCRRFAGGCPYPTLKILRILAQAPGWARSSAARKGVELLLDLAGRKETRYGFGFGARFDKLRYPFIGFDVLHVLEATSPFPQSWKDERFRTLLDSVVEKADSAGRYTAESVWMEWKQLCFGRKDAPSPWLSLVVHRILARQPRRKTSLATAK